VTDQDLIVVVVEDVVDVAEMEKDAEEEIGGVEEVENVGEEEEVPEMDSAPTHPTIKKDLVLTTIIKVVLETIKLKLM